MKLDNLTRIAREVVSLLEKEGATIKEGGTILEIAVSMLSSSPVKLAIPQDDLHQKVRGAKQVSPAPTT